MMSLHGGITLSFVACSVSSLANAATGVYQDDEMSLMFLGTLD
jgi:hypothetical protein